MAGYNVCDMGSTQSLENSDKRVSRVLRVHEMKTMYTALARGSGAARPRVGFLIVGERPELQLMGARFDLPIIRMFM